MYTCHTFLSNFHLTKLSLFVTNWHYQIVITKLSLPNCHYQIVITKSSLTNSHYQIFITKFSLPNSHYQIVVTKLSSTYCHYFTVTLWFCEVPTKCGLDYFSLFDGYWIQTDTQTYPSSCKSKHY